MANPWTTIVEMLASGIADAGELTGGGQATGIVLMTFAVRAALIPILGPLGVRTRQRQRVVRRIRPQIKELDRRFRDHPGTLSKRLKELHAEHGIGTVDWAGLGGALVQLPILIALFQAVLLTWEADAMTLGGLGSGLAASALAVIGTKVGGQADGATWMLWLSALMPLGVCLWLGPGIGLYLIGFYSAIVVQAALVRPGPTTEEPVGSRPS